VLARAVIATIDALGARGATVIGNSMGGYLCMRAALIDPAAIGRLVNLHSPGVPTARMFALRWALRVLPARWLLRRDPERWVHKNVDDEASQFAHVDAAPRFVAAIEPFIAASFAS